jgi:predicted nucleotidyltransferase
VIENNKRLMENIEGLLKRKESSHESEEITPIPFFQEFIEKELEVLKSEEAQLEQSKEKADSEKLNDLFREVVIKVRKRK